MTKMTMAIMAVPLVPTDGAVVHVQMIGSAPMYGSESNVYTSEPSTEIQNSEFNVHKTKAHLSKHKHQNKHHTTKHHKTGEKNT